MEQIIREFYKTIFKLTNEEVLDYLVKNSTLKDVKKKTHLFKMGDTITQAYFLNSGFCYGYTQKNDKRKIIDCLVYKRGWLAMKGPELKPETLEFNIFCPCDTQFVVTSFEALLTVISQSPDGQQAYIEQLNEMVEYHYNIHKIRTLAPIERVQGFLEYFSECVPLMNNTEIAAFLNMSRPEYLKAKKASNISSHSL